MLTPILPHTQPRPYTSLLPTLTAVRSDRGISRLECTQLSTYRVFPKVTGEDLADMDTVEDVREVADAAKAAECRLFLQRMRDVVTSARMAAEVCVCG